MVKLLIIDDELALCDVLKAFFLKRGYHVFIATSGKEGLTIVEKEQPHIVLLDIIMPGSLGTGVLQAIRKIAPQVKVIMLTGVSNESVIRQAKEHGAVGYVTKPFSLEDLENNVLPMILKQIIS